MSKRYDIKFFIKNTDILVFRSFLVNTNSYRLIDVKGFGINENYENLFLRIIQGKFKVKYYDKSKFKDNEVAKAQYIEVNENNAIKNIEAVQKLNSNLVGVSIKSNIVELQKMLSFSYEGYSLNLQDGLLPKNANKVSNITTELISAISINNTNFGEVYQMENRAGSTIVPFFSERIDNDALKVLIKIIKDININKIDVEYIRRGKKFSKLYKKVIRILKDLRKIKGLKEFQIIIKENKYIINNLKLLDKLDMYSESVNGNAEVRYYEGQLKSRKNRYVIVVEEDNKDMRLHFDTQNNNFKSIVEKAKNLTAGTKIKYNGYSEGEETILIDKLIIFK